MILQNVLNKHYAILLLALILGACSKANEPVSIAPATELESSANSLSQNSSSAVDNSSIENAYQDKQSDVQVSGHGKVVKLLAEDNHGSRHQKFLVKVNSRQTLLFAHNIDLAAKIPLQVGDEITFKGEYVYNPKGGIIHWTHLDPHGHHPSGWVMLNGNKYQ